MFDINTLLILIVSLPLASAVITAALGPKVLKSHSHWPTIAALAAAFVCALLLFLKVDFEQGALQGEEAHVVVSFEQIENLWTWANVTGAYSPEDATFAHDVSDTTGVRNFDISIVLRADALTAVMLVMVTFIATLVAIYSHGYMHGDPGYWRFYTYVSLFVFSMTMLVSVSNFLLLYVFWEAVGACSYLLIGFWYQKPEAAAAGKKAFLVNRVGDFGFALAIFLIWLTYGTLNFHDTKASDSPQTAATAAENATGDGEDIRELSNNARQMQAVPGVLGASRLKSGDYASGGLAMAICLLLMLGACGKSAQFPLHVWLPDAMEGPTPVSALIHAATMVTAGVYMVARCSPLFMASPEAQLVVACIGGFTALLAGLIALTQFDLKRVLAYSTISQLGYMFLALGCGTFVGISAGMFHLLTHAFFKALLFLGAGSVMHAMGGIIDMRRFGGLRKVMPITYVTFALGCLALSGLPPFAGFWSKDAILAAVEEKGHELHGHAAHAEEEHHANREPGILLASHDEHNARSQAGSVRHVAFASFAPATEGETLFFGAMSRQTAGTIYLTLFYSGMFTAFLTAFYTFRAFFMTFHGEKLIPHEAGHHAHESPAPMWIPLAILAAFAAGAGLFGTYYSASTKSFLIHAPSLATSLVPKPHGPHDHTHIEIMSTILGLVAVGLAAYLYLGHRGEINWIAWLFKFQWLERFAGMPWVAWLANRPAAAGIRRGADAIYLGWLARLVGWVLVLLIGILLSPLLLGYYLSPYKLSQNKFYFDEIYNWLLVKPLEVLAFLSYVFDRWVVDGLVNFIGWVPKALGSVVRTLQMGLVQFYALAMVLGVVVIAAMLVFGGSK